MKVDLITQDRELEDKMLAEYPGKIFEDQYEKCLFYPNTKLFIFKELNKSQLEDFLKNHQDCDYVIYAQGRPITFNKLEKVKIDWNKYFKEQSSMN